MAIQLVLNSCKYVKLKSAINTWSSLFLKISSMNSFHSVHLYYEGLTSIYHQSFEYDFCRSLSIPGSVWWNSSYLILLWLTMTIKYYKILQYTTYSTLLQSQQNGRPASAFYEDRQMNFQYYPVQTNKQIASASEIWIRPTRCKHPTSPIIT